MEPRKLSQLAHVLWVAGPLIATVLLAGCGETEAPAPPPAPSALSATQTATAAAASSDPAAAASQLVAQADAICRRLNEQLAASSRHIEASGIARAAARHAALERRSAAELARLRPPASLAADWRRIVLYRETSAEELVAFVRAVQAKDARATSTFAASKRRVHQSLSALATKDGFTDCARIGPGSAATSPLSSSPLSGGHT